MPNLGDWASIPTPIPDSPEPATQPAYHPATPPPTSPNPKPANPRAVRQSPIDFPETDPWASPALHRGHNHDTSSVKANEAFNPTSNGIQEPVRTTSNFTTASSEQPNRTASQPPGDTPAAPTAGVWGSYDSVQATTFGNSENPTIGGGGFGNSGDGGDRPVRNTPSRSFGGGRVTGGGVEENITVTLLPEKEGMFMFQHHNYQVTSPRRGTKVVRRYSDFVWLLDCLHKRYPFRQLPLLPPKRVGGMYFFFSGCKSLNTLSRALSPYIPNLLNVRVCHEFLQH